MGEELEGGGGGGGGIGGLKEAWNLADHDNYVHASRPIIFITCMGVDRAPLQMKVN